MISTDLESRLLFPIVTTTQRPDQLYGVWKGNIIIIQLELTVPWEENISDAEHIKEAKQEEKAYI